jgi:hypothetical protein
MGTGANDLFSDGSFQRWSALVGAAELRAKWSSSKNAWHAGASTLGYPDRVTVLCLCSQNRAQTVYKDIRRGQ